jgi:hypothetical protein
VGRTSDGKKTTISVDSPASGVHRVPSLSGQILEQVLKAFKTPSQIKLLQYIDDLLTLRIKKKKVTRATINLLNFLCQQELRVSKSKLQFMEKEVKYLKHLISEGK